MNRRLFSILCTVMLGMTAIAQTPIAGVLPSYNEETRGTARRQQYWPEAGAFVCENGTNRFTRALYGSHTDWRLETSDRPVFAVVKKGHHRNIRFVLEYEGQCVPLDSTTRCVSFYKDGERTYRLGDKRWGDAELLVEVVAMPDREAALWHFSGAQFVGRVKVHGLSSDIATPRLHRNGDIGADKPGCFEASGPVLQEAVLGLEAGAGYVEVDLDQLRISEPQVAEGLYLSAAQHFRQMAGRIVFHTPDPYINTLASALVMAADGDWDGQTWLHGCIGWRMPLAGWRAAYAGDVLGWNDRAVSHFDAYAKSQVTDVPATIPHPSQDAKMNMARAEKKWGTQMYSNGYICRNPERNDQMHHYDMNLNYMDELLWHFEYDADTAYMRRMWPVIERHLAWEKRNFDPDGDHLYDAYCCIWASDALYYSGGAVTHSSAYNYRGNRLAARIAEIIGKDPEPYRQEADAILKAMNSGLWMKDKGVWAEFQDGMGLRRLHESPAVWSIYTPIDCGACTQEQAWQATDYVSRHIPHIPVEDTGLQTIATSNWLPYSWSINNVANAEVWHTALAYFEAGRKEEGFQLMKANILDNMYYGQSPANFGQLSHYDAARGECYRDFGDCIGIASRTLLQGFFGVVPHALDGQCMIAPGFPAEWDSVSLHTPYIDYKYTRKGNRIRCEITQHFRQPLKMVFRQYLDGGRFLDVEGTDEEHQVIEAMSAEELPSTHPSVSPSIRSTVSPSPRPSVSPSTRLPVNPSIRPSTLGLEAPDLSKPFRQQQLAKYFNAEVDDIFKNQYLSPRPSSTTLQIPVQGVGEWCHPQYTPEINDSVFRTFIVGDGFAVAGVPFRTPRQGPNIAYTSLWDNYPDSIAIPLKGRASSAYLLMAGSTNHIQCHIDNGLVVVAYTDHSSDTLRLRNPDNWCPIEQDFFIDGKAFQTVEPRPYRVCLGTGTVSRDLGEALNIKGVYGREIPGGAAQMLRMPLNPQKKLESVTLRTLSNDVVIGLMAITLQ